MSPSPLGRRTQNVLRVISMPETVFPHLSEPSFEAEWSFRTSCISFRQSHPACPSLPNIATLIGGAAAVELSRRVVSLDQVEEKRQWSIIFSIIRPLSANQRRSLLSRLLFSLDFSSATSFDLQAEGFLSTYRRLTDALRLPSDFLSRHFSEHLRGIILVDFRAEIEQAVYEDFSRAERREPSVDDAVSLLTTAPAIAAAPSS